MMTMKKSEHTVPEPELRFEDALQKLEGIVREMETGTPSLDDLLTRFEEGRRLAEFCQKKLETVERRITTLIEGEKGATEQPLDPGAIR
jgi:exodeoxyribonuclease VII small subunit